MIDKIQIIHADWEETFKGMPYESVGRVMMALIAFAKDEDPNEYLGDDIQAKTIFPAIKGHVVRNENARLKGSTNGSKGGAPIGNQNARKTTENNQKQPKTTKDKQKQTPNLTLPNLTIPNNKKQYGFLIHQYKFPPLGDNPFNIYPICSSLRSVPKYSFTEFLSITLTL